MLFTTALSATLCFGTTASEMDSVKTSAKRTKARPNLVIVQIDKDGNETSYPATTAIKKEELEENAKLADTLIEEIVTDKNKIKSPVSKDEMDQANSVPQWFYIGVGCPFVTVTTVSVPCYYWYSYTYYPIVTGPCFYYAPRYHARHHFYHHIPPRHHCHYRFYWN